MTHRVQALIAAPAPAQERLWLTGVRLFDGTGAALRENTAIPVAGQALSSQAPGEPALSRPAT